MEPMLLAFNECWILAATIRLGNGFTSCAEPMVRPGRDKLSGVVEVDETYVGGKKPVKRGRGAEGKALVGIVVEDKGGESIGRIRLLHLEDASSKSLTPFVQGVVDFGSP